MGKKDCTSRNKYSKELWDNWGKKLSKVDSKSFKKAAKRVAKKCDECKIDATSVNFVAETINNLKNTGKLTDRNSIMDETDLLVPVNSCKYAKHQLLNTLTSSLRMVFICVAKLKLSIDKTEKLYQTQFKIPSDVTEMDGNKLAEIMEKNTDQTIGSIIKKFNAVAQSLDNELAEQVKLPKKQKHKSKS